MGDTLKLLQYDFLSSIPTAIIVIILLVILERIFFRPIAEVTKRRAEASTGAQEFAREQIAAAAAKSKEYDDALRAARLAVYNSREQERRNALTERDAALKTARERAEGLVKKAQAAVAAEVASAKEQLAASSQALAAEITGRILEDGGSPRVEAR
ncbi:MAG: hypothetical protein ACRD1N_02050 [Terriglobia bacterium]